MSKFFLTAALSLTVTVCTSLYLIHDYTATVFIYDRQWRAYIPAPRDVSGGGVHITTRALSRKFRSAENFGPGTEIPGKSVLPGLKFSKIFENFGPCVEKWSAHLEFKGRCTQLLSIVRALVKELL